ncbi:MAG: microcin C transport system permease protein [Hyphomicrobiaceae bacterium]|jgi:microcin C transport system permease protein
MNMDAHPDQPASHAGKLATKTGFCARLRDYLTLTPINQRRWYNFKANRRGYWSLWVFLAVFGSAMLADVIANDRPIIASYKGEILLPFLYDYPEDKIGGFLATIDYREEFARDEFKQHGWMIWPPIRYSYDTVNNNYPRRKNSTGDCLGFPSPPHWLEKGGFCDEGDAAKMASFTTFGNRNWLGTDDQGRDVAARVLHGMRISILFGLILTVLASVIGIVAGAVQGYFGGWVDLIAQRIIEIWSSMPYLYILIIISSVLVPGFWTLLGIVLLFSWTSLVSVVRAEFLRGRNFEYITAARALGVSDATIMFKHLLPNAMVATLTFLPFQLTAAITALTSLDFLGLGLPPGSPSLGELLSQGKNNLQAPWLGLAGFFSIALLLSLLVFIGEAVRDALDPRKTFK